jgi:hypothetical protein
LFLTGYLPNSKAKENRAYSFDPPAAKTICHASLNILNSTTCPICSPPPPARSDQPDAGDRYNLITVFEIFEYVPQP